MVEHVEGELREKTAASAAPRPGRRHDPELRRPCGAPPAAPRASPWRRGGAGCGVAVAAAAAAAAGAAAEGGRGRYAAGRRSTAPGTAPRPPSWVRAEARR